MGFDINGIKPINEKGVYFTNNVWWWRPLWWTICKHTPELTQHERQTGQYNDGLVIDGDKHTAVVRTLKWLVKEKPRRDEFASVDADYGKLGNTSMRELDARMFGQDYRFHWDNVQSFLEFCEGNQGFKIN
ncbi:MAG: hypothetical protein ACFFF4_14075 [Candidatus Thorarchaeota archaeon]